jgi:hypothetical protein
VRVRDGLGIGRGLGGGRSIELHDSIDTSAKSECANVPSRAFAHGGYLRAPSPESKRHAAKKVHFPGTETPPLVVYSSRKPDDTRS